MGSFCTSKKKDKQTSATTFDPYVTQASKNILGTATSAAGANPFQTRAGELAMDTTNPFLNAAEGVAGNLTGTYDLAQATPTMDFFEANIATPQLQEIDRTLAMSQNATNSKYGGSGLAGYRNVLAGSANAAEAARAKAGILGNARMQGLQFGADQFNLGLGRNAAAAGILGNLGATSESVRQSQVGGLNRQGMMDLEKQRVLAGILGMLPRNQYGRGTATSSQGANIFGTLAGAGATAAGAYFGGGV